MKIAFKPICTVSLTLGLLSTFSCNHVFSQTTDSSASTTTTTRVVADKASLNALAAAFHQIHIASLKLRHTKQEIRDEFNRSSLKIITFDDYINQYIDGKTVAYNEQLYPYGFQNMGNTSTVAGDPEPPRKEYVAHYLNDMNNLLNLQQQEVDTAVKLLDSMSLDASITPMKKSLMEAKNTIAITAKSINELCTAVPPNKDAVSNACATIHSQLLELDTTCRLTAKMVLASLKNQNTAR